MNNELQIMREEGAVIGRERTNHKKCVSTTVGVVDEIRIDDG